MRPFVLCWVSSCFCAYKASHVKRKSMMYFYSFLAIMIPAVMGGLRACGVDIGAYAWPGYIRSMRASSFSELYPNGISLSMLGIGLELGWNLVTYYSTKLFENIHWNLFMYQLITITCFYIGAWKHRKSAPLWLIMLMFFFIEYNHTYNIMRQSVACAIIFMEIDVLEERKYLQFFLWIIVAAWFHTSVVICVIYMLLLHLVITSPTLWRHNKRKKNFLLYSAFGLLAFTRPLISLLFSLLPISAKYAHYTTVTREEVSGWFGVGWSQVLLAIGEAVLFLLYANGAKKEFKANWIGGEGMFEYCRYIVFLMIIFRFGVGFFDRMILYLEWLNILILASLPSFVKEKHLNAIVLVSVIGAAFLTLWHIHILKGMVSGQTWPYRSILD